VEAAWVALDTRRTLTFETAISFDGHRFNYPTTFLDVTNGSPRQQAIHDFLMWLSERPNLQKDGIKLAQKYINGSLQLGRLARGLEMLPPGHTNLWMDVRAAKKSVAVARGVKEIVSGKDSRPRASKHLPSFDEMCAMMHLCLAGDSRIHRSPLRALQTGFEMRVTHVCGIRGQLVRSARCGHVWLSDNDALAGGAGIKSVVMWNNRGDKTHLVGDASHTGWLPSRNPLLCPSKLLGTCFLLRFTTGEVFPTVDEGGIYYKWLPLVASDETSSVDMTNAELAVRCVSAESQNAAFNMLHAAAGVDMYAGDAVTHAGKAACTQECEAAGLDSRTLEKALHFQVATATSGQVMGDHYGVKIPLEFELQRAFFSQFPNPQEWGEVDAAQFRVLRKHEVVVNQLADLAVPELAEQEREVSKIVTQPERMELAAVMAQKRANTASHVREHREVLAFLRYHICLAIVCAACRPRDKDGKIRYDQPSLVDEHADQPVYKAIRIRSTDGWLFDHPLFHKIREAIRQEEEYERNNLPTSMSASTSKQAAANAAATVQALRPSLDRIESMVSSTAESASTAITTATAAAGAAASAADAISVQERALEIADARDLERVRRGELEPDWQQKEKLIAESTARSQSLLAMGAVLPATSPMPPSLPPPADSAATAAAQSVGLKRKRRVDIPDALPQASFGDFRGSVQSLFDEFVGPDGSSGLRARTGNWHGAKGQNKASRDLFNDKHFFYREIAKQKRDLGGDIHRAISAVQARVDGLCGQRGSGFSAVLKLLKTEQINKSAEKAELDRLVKLL